MEPDFIELTGTTDDRKSIKVDVAFNQFFRLKLPKDTVEEEVDGIIQELKDQLGLDC